MKKDSVIKNLVIYNAGFEFFKEQKRRINGEIIKCPMCQSTEAHSNGYPRMICTSCGKQWSIFRKVKK